MKYCPKCMIDLTDSNKFCKLCGGPSAEKPAARDSGLRCPGCGTEARPTWKVCTRCGHHLQPALSVSASSSICRVCGKANRAGVTFCDGCGNSLEGQQASDVIDGGMGAQPARELFDPEATRRSVLEPDALEPTEAVSPIPCARCGATLRAGLAFCEMCGAPAAYLSPARQGQGLKWLLISAAALVVLGGAVAGWHFWGVKLTITVSADQPGQAQVFLDDEKLGETEGKLIVNHLARGSYTLRVERTGYEPYVATVILGVTDFSKDVDAAISRSKFALTITGATKDSEVFLDGNKTGEWDGRTDWIIRGVVGGVQHALLVKRPGYRDFKKDVVLSAAKSERVEWIMSAAGDWSGTYWESFASTPVYTTFSLAASDGAIATASRSEFSGMLTITNVSSSPGIRPFQSAEPVRVRVTDAYINSTDKAVSFKFIMSGETYNFFGSLDTELRRVSGRWYPSGPGLGGEWNMSRNLPARTAALN
jgi:hypothetical protein